MSKGKQGFAMMDPKRHREICRLGGIAAHRKGVGHEWTADEARAAGRLGGLKTAKLKQLELEDFRKPQQDAGVRPQGDVRHEPEVV